MRLHRHNTFRIDYGKLLEAECQLAHIHGLRSTSVSIFISTTAGWSSRPS